jgi:hypothetical protein
MPISDFVFQDKGVVGVALGEHFLTTGIVSIPVTAAGDISHASPNVQQIHRFYFKAVLLGLTYSSRVVLGEVPAGLALSS